MKWHEQTLGRIGDRRRHGLDKSCRVILASQSRRTETEVSRL